MKNNFLFFMAVLALFCAGCSEKNEEPQSQQQLNQPVIQKKPVIPLDSSQYMEGKKENKLDSIDELKIKKIMETDDFKKLKHEQDRYNDSLNDANVKNIPRRPGPEGVLRKLVEMCKEKGNCPHE